MDTKLTAMMVDDFLHDPVLAAKVILGIHCPPHMEVALWSMWTKKFVIDHSGFGTGKTLRIAIVALLRAMLMRNRTELFISRSFAQATHQMHQPIRDWTRTRPIVRSQMKLSSTGRAPGVYSNDTWETPFANGSIIRTVPPSFGSSGERVAGEDCTDGYFDEVTKYGDYIAFARQMLTRVRKPVDPAYGDATHVRPLHDDPIFGRHFFMAGTAKYTWHPMYSKVEAYREQVKGGSTQHDVITFESNDIVRFFGTHPEYAEFTDLKAIKDLEVSLPRAEAEQEVRGRWTKDSAGWYSHADVMAARRECVPILIGRE